MTFDEYLSTRLRSLVRYATAVTLDPHLAEDITQEVLLRAQQKWARISRHQQPEAYLKKMIINEFLSWRRRRAARVVPLSTTVLDTLIPPVDDQTAELDAREAARQLLAGLPPRQRAAVALRYYEDLPDDEIADLLGCRTATVRSQISRALATLRDAVPLRPAIPMGREQ